MLTSFKRYLVAKIHRMFLWNEEDDEYMGYEEQGVSYNDWKQSHTSKVNPHSLFDYQEIEIEN